MPVDFTHQLKHPRSLLLWAMLLSLAGIGAGYFFYAQFPEYNWLLFFLPASLLFVVFLLFRSFNSVFWLAVCCTPLSLAALDTTANVGISLPNEPLIIILMLVILLRLLFVRSIDMALLKHPISIGIYLYLGWLLITSCTSTLPLVSFKFLLSRIWFIVVFYFYGVSFFREKKNISRFIWLYSLPLAATVINTLIQHRESGFSRDAAFYVMSPFFIDHGVYAATIAFMVPPLIALLWIGRKGGQSQMLQLLGFGITLLFVAGILLSYTRAAWLSLAAAAALAAVMLFRIRLWFLVLASALTAVVYINFKDDIAVMLSRNKQASDTGFDRQFQSITNISTDNSNLERINRWNSAIAMFKEKPVTGFGPGTYIFKYAPYQHSSDLTPISTNFGDGGNSHSEYLNPLAETGLPGMLMVILFVLLLLHTGMKLVYHARMTHVKWLARGITLGLVTYYTHGVLNNYSDSDKTMVLIWAFAGMLASLDIYGASKQKK